jgi:hypothetical protein
MILAFIILGVSLLLLYIGIQGIISLWLAVICFWGRVSFREPANIEYNFKPGGSGLIAFVLGFAGTLWSVIFLAIKIAAIVA